MQTLDRLTAVDLRDLTEEEHAALRQQAILANLSLSEYLGQLVGETSRKLVQRKTKPSQIRKTTESEVKP